MLFIKQMYKNVMVDSLSIVTTLTIVTMGSYLRIQSNPQNGNIIGLKTFVYQWSNSFPVINLALMEIKCRIKWFTGSENHLL